MGNWKTFKSRGFCWRTTWTIFQYLAGFLFVSWGLEIVRLPRYKLERITLYQQSPMWCNLENIPPVLRRSGRAPALALSFFRPAKLFSYDRYMSQVRARRLRSSVWCTGLAARPPQLAVWVRVPAAAAFFFCSVLRSFPEKRYILRQPRGFESQERARKIARSVSLVARTLTKPVNTHEGELCAFSAARTCNESALESKGRLGGGPT
ncbi:hypothetical protein BO82DRAFT_124132 [Aspergillus uvarum CBS 121591]|uniref:Uncharacterized protein n=1 Tax=Aspergillus uvarum CBS 121591 TaxID=1448315 RepID=A0A319DK36_9EURO|nr:hypothetical protein BO82DRAFT_124132 [Aspergillus uvarum CBS 121591]PYH79832.1 hypothetical protein BO82DRAFT_124132 [Aspergillus uvarum CBS 121591]